MRLPLPFTHIVAGFLIALIGVQPGRAAELLSSYSYNSGYSVSGMGTLQEQGDDSTDTSARLSFASSLVPQINGFVETAYGVQRASVHTVNYGGGAEPLQNGNAQTKSRWTDTFTILGGVGLGTAVLQMSIDGDVQVSPLNRGAQLAGVVLNVVSSRGVGMQYHRNEHYDPAGSFETWHGTSFVNGVLTREFSFVYGEPFAIWSDLVVQAQEGGIANFGSTIVAGLLLPNGATLTTESGGLYAPIPGVSEPATYALSLVGLGVVVVGRRRLAAGQRCT